LHRRQEQAWLDLHKFVESRFDHAPALAIGANEGIVMTRKRPPHKPNSGLPHPPTLYEKTETWTFTLDAWHLVSLHSICAQAKSFIVALALLEKDHTDSPFKTDLSKAVEASRVEEEFQIAMWGLVEGGHDYDRLNCSVQLHSAQLFARCILLDNNL
jgi:ATP synthase mitochondrial F1 complex assembly factor 2